MNRHARDNALWAGIAAALMLYYGWGTGGWAIPSDATAFYETTIRIFDWMLRIGGILLAVVAVLCFAGIRLALLMDAFVSGLCGLIMVACPAYWILNDGLGIQYLMYVVFGVMFLNAARGCWTAFHASGPATAGTPSRRTGWFGVQPLPAPQAPPPPDPVHPASIHPESLPKDGEPPPPEGYLAALSKEKDEPPTASYE